MRWIRIKIWSLNGTRNASSSSRYSPVHFVSRSLILKLNIFMNFQWGAQAFQNMLIVPPGSGIVHQVNLEYLARVVFNQDGLLYPDSVVGTDSHTTMINGLGVLGWGVGGIEAEAVMLGTFNLNPLNSIIFGGRFMGCS